MVFGNLEEVGGCDQGGNEGWWCGLKEGEGRGYWAEESWLGDRGC